MSNRAAGLVASLCAAALLAACSAGPGRPRGPQGSPLRPIAQPGEVVAREIAFARAVREDGQRTAFLEFAAEGAVMFVPGPVRAGEWLKDHDLPASPLSWQPHRVWSSCDGSLAVTRGAWQRESGSFGYFITIWQRQEDGSYKWALNQGDTLEQPLQEPEMIGAEVADCPQRRAGPPQPGQNLPAVSEAADGSLLGKALDGSLIWSVDRRAQEGWQLRVSMSQNGEMSEVLSAKVASPE